MISPAGQLGFQFGFETKLMNEIFTFLTENPRDYKGAIQKFPTVPAGCFEMFDEMLVTGGLFTC
jgi:hypothetical protein